MQILNFVATSNAQLIELSPLRRTDCTSNHLPRAVGVVRRVVAVPAPLVITSSRRNQCVRLLRRGLGRGGRTGTEIRTNGDGSRNGERGPDRKSERNDIATGKSKLIVGLAASETTLEPNLKVDTGPKSELPARSIYIKDETTNSKSGRSRERKLL
ncbi:hypothetical protein EVAR_54152_1 [Eumeta japonica]|uniref:Uncharacterized protein n=1 Tax=Eumeta variegata TaxID=151549 RepID=A0A4C1Y2I9_EUMVA|nr:hypothetical protein EVAR_54152_1 [Eumeta japonica]